MATDVRGGGVAVIYKDCWKSRRVNFQLELRSFEFLCVRIDVKPTSILDLCHYISTAHNQFLNPSSRISRSFWRDL